MDKNKTTELEAIPVAELPRPQEPDNAGAIDRASGSGVFARDPDAQLDMIQLELTDDLKNNARDSNATAWRLEGLLREFPGFEPVNFWFDYPIHQLDAAGHLDGMHVKGSPMGNLTKSRKYTTPEERRASVDAAYSACSNELPVSLDDMAAHMAVSPRYARDRIKELRNEYKIKGGFVFRIEKKGNGEAKSK